MGKPELEWKKIPLAKEMDTRSLNIKFDLDNYKIIGSPSAVSMGNPHCIFFIKDFSDIDYRKIGARIEIHSIFPEQANIGFVKIINENQIQLKVWERGVGMTLACGTGACAAVVAAVRQKRVKNKVRVQVDGGELFIDWEKNSQHVLMTGPVELEQKKILKNYF
jgi:diaminopimelate epimerase